MSGVWAFGWVEMVSAKNELCAFLIDEESEMLEVRVCSIARRDAEIAALVSSMREQLEAPRAFIVLNRGAADALRAAGIREEIEVGSSPALEDAILALEETLKSGALEGDKPEKESSDVELSAFFEAAERFVSIAPWSRFPEGATFEVRAPSLEIERGGVFLMGTNLESAGWVLAFSEEDVAGIPFVDGATDEPSSAMAMCIQPLEDKLVPVLARSVRGTGIVHPSTADYELATIVCRALIQLAENASGEVQLEAANGAVVSAKGPI